MNRKFPAPFIATRQALSRRRFLRGVGVAMSLPLLDAMQPRFARAASDSLTPNAKPRRMLGICNNLGVRPDLFFPTGAGRDYVASPYLKLLEAHRNDFTVISGVSHPNVDGGHPSDISFLTAAPHPASSSFRNTISLDQYIAERIGTLTRFPSLTLAVNGAARSLSWTGTGVAIPPEERASDVFNQLFLQGTPEQVAAQIHRLDTGRSILDAVADQAKELATQCRRARPQPSRAVFHQRPRPRAPPAGVARLGAQTQAGRELCRAGRDREVRRNTWTR